VKKPVPPGQNALLHGRNAPDSGYSGLGTAAQYSQALNSIRYCVGTTKNPPPEENIIIYALDQYGARSADASVQVNIIAVNDPPVNTIPTFGAGVNANTPLTFFGNVSISDPDAGANPVQVSLTAEHGTMTLSKFSGLTFYTGDGIADLAMVFSGTISNINSALNQMSFMPDMDYIGSASLNIITEDLGNTGSGGPLFDNDTIPIAVWCTAPLIWTQPQNVSASDGDFVNFNVAAIGPGLTYQWHRNGVNIEGAISSHLTIQVTIDDDGTTYSVTVLNDCGEIESDSASLSVSLGYPSITLQPESQTVTIGSIVVFEVQATGGWLSYQWQFNGSDIPGETGPILILPDVQLEASGYYSVLVYT